MVSHWSLRDSKSSLASNTIITAADLNHAVVWMVSTRPLISNSSSLFINLFCGCTKRTKYNWYRSHYVPSFFQLPSKVLVFISLIAFFQFYRIIRQNSKVHYLAGSFFFSVIINKSGRLANISWSIFISKSQRIVCFIDEDGFLVVYIPFVRMFKF